MHLHDPTELDNFPEGEIEEMVQLYTTRGLPEATARSVISSLASFPSFFVDVMMLEELQLPPPPPISPLAAAIRYGASTVVCGGAMPLVGIYLHSAALDVTRESATSHPASGHLLLMVLGLLALCYLGSLRASITHQRRWQLALQTAALALPCIACARLLGSLMPSVAHAGPARALP